MNFKIIFIILLLHSLSAFSQTDGFRMKFCVDTYDYDYFNKLIQRQESPAGEMCVIKTKSAEWKIKTTVNEHDEYKEVHVVFHLEKGNELSANVSIQLVFDQWEKDNYVLMPAAAYNGNRFPWRRIAYSPKLLDPKDIGKNAGTIITDVPRLDVGSGFSRIQERSGSMAVPSIGFYSMKKSGMFFLLTGQANEWGDYGVNIEENRERSQAVISLCSPLVREYYKYNIADNMDVTPDIPADFQEGDLVSFHFRLYRKEASCLQELFDFYAQIRQDVVGKPSFVPRFPFSGCFSIQEKKFNTQNFVPEWGYYSVGMRNMFLQDWQIGWTGGMISTYPLLFAGGKESEENVKRNFDWLFPDGVAPSGFFWDSGEKGNKWYGGDIRKPHTQNWHLIRKSGDGLYYIIKQLMLMEQKRIEVKPSWKEGTKQVADAFVRLWNKERQFGQFVDNLTGEVIVGGSTSGAIVPAAMTLAASFFENKHYQEIAEASAQKMYEEYVSHGITAGGPGDALQNPDSESAYAMLESFALLYEMTRNPQWLNYAEDMATQFSTWVMGYDYRFPEASLFGRLDMHTTGAVFANTQNKHGSPGICTHSGVALLRLYRITGNKRYLDWLKEITFNLPQYMSHPDRSVGGMDHGWINERVSTTDWFEGIGEIFPGSTWAETALMLTYIEIPGIYVDLSRQIVYAFDHIHVTLETCDKKKAVIILENQTNYAADVRLFVDNKESLKQALKENYLFQERIIRLKPGEKRKVTVKK